jgi:hypothetical protein
MALPFGQERDWSPPDQTLRPTLPKQRVPGDPPREGQIFHRVTSAVLGPQAAHGLVSNPKVMSLLLDVTFVLFPKRSLYPLKNNS